MKPMATRTDYRQIAANWLRRDQMIRAMERRDSALAERRPRSRVRLIWDQMFHERLLP